MDIFKSILSQFLPSLVPDQEAMSDTSDMDYAPPLPDYAPHITDYAPPLQEGTGIEAMHHEGHDVTPDIHRDDVTNDLTSGASGEPYAPVSNLQEDVRESFGAAGDADVMDDATNPDVDVTDLQDITWQSGLLPPPMMFANDEPYDTCPFPTPCGPSLDEELVLYLQEYNRRVSQIKASLARAQGALKAGQFQTAIKLAETGFRLLRNFTPDEIEIKEDLYHLNYTLLRLCRICFCQLGLVTESFEMMDGMLKLSNYDDVTVRDAIGHMNAVSAWLRRGLHPAQELLKLKSHINNTMVLAETLEMRGCYFQAMHQWTKAAIVLEGLFRLGICTEETKIARAFAKSAMCALQTVFPGNLTVALENNDAAMNDWNGCMDYQVLQASIFIKHHCLSGNVQYHGRNWRREIIRDLRAAQSIQELDEDLKRISTLVGWDGNSRKVLQNAEEKSDELDLDYLEGLLPKAEMDKLKNRKLKGVSENVVKRTRTGSAGSAGSVSKPPNKKRKEKMKTVTRRGMVADAAAGGGVATGNVDTSGATTDITAADMAGAASPVLMTTGSTITASGNGSTKIQNNKPRKGKKRDSEIPLRGFPKFPDQPCKPRLKRAKAASTSLFDELSENYYVTTGCTDCPLSIGDTHSPCSGNCVKLTRKVSQGDKDSVVIVRKRPPRYKKGSGICEKFAAGGSCLHRHHCPYPHNEIEEEIFSRELSQDAARRVSLTDFLNDMKVSQLKLSCSVASLHGRFRGRLDFRCRVCLQRDQPAEKKHNIPICKAGHDWITSRVLVIITQDAVFQLSDEVKVEGTNAEMIKVVIAEVQRLKRTGATEEEIVDEAKRLEQKRKSIEKNEMNAKIEKHKFLANRLMGYSNTRMRNSSFCSTGSDASDMSTDDLGDVTLDTDSDLESVYASDEEEDTEETDMTSGKDSYYHLDPPPILEQLLKTQPDRYRRCIILLKGTDEAMCRTLDGNLEIKINGRMNCGPCFDGDEVLVEILQFGDLDNTQQTVTRGRVRGILQKKGKRQHKVFVCRVGYYHGNLMKPMCGSAPKFSTIDKACRKNHPKDHLHRVAIYGRDWRVKQIIRVDIENREKLVFLVKYLKWSPNNKYPLGIVRGVISAGVDYTSSQKILNLIHNIPLTERQEQEVDPSSYQAVTDAGKKVRTDLRDLPTLSIDPDGSTDLDDAISVVVPEQQECYYVYVHIADVSEMVAMDSSIDRDARRRGCTFYIPRQGAVAPMIPRALSEGVCSLVEGKDRLAMSVRLKVGKDGQICDTQVLQSVIRNDARLTYTKVQEEILGSVIVNPLSETIKQQISLLYKIAMRMRRRRLGSGIYHQEKQEDGDAHALVEEFMIAANSAVGEYLRRVYPSQTPRRVQVEPNPAKLEIWREKHGNSGDLSFYLSRLPRNTNGQIKAAEVPTASRPVLGTSVALRRPVVPGTSAALTRQIVSSTSVALLRPMVADVLSCLDRGDARAAVSLLGLEKVTPRLALDMIAWYEIQNKAEYIAGAGDERHYTLGLDNYTHFTSPIRRYIDIIVHRLLKRALGKKESPYSEREVRDICAEMNIRMLLSKRFDKKSRLLDDIYLFSRRPSYLLGFIQTLDDGSMEVTFPGLPDAERSSRNIRFSHLGVASKPEVRENEDAVILRWQRKIFDNGPYPQNARTKGEIFEKYKLDPNTHVKFMSEEDWKSCVDAIASGAPEEKLMVTLKAAFERSTCREGRGGYRQEVTSEMKYPDKLVRHHVDFSYEMRESGVLPVQMTVRSVEGLLQPYPQLLQLTPQVHLCMEHKKDPVPCFARVAKRASQTSYQNETEYRDVWLPIIAMETATCSVSDSDPIMVHNVPVTLETVNKDVYGTLKLDHLFCRTRHLEVMKAAKNKKDFDEDETSDFLCIRCPYGDDVTETRDSMTRDPLWVGHAVVESRSTREVMHEGEERKEITLKFRINQEISVNCQPPQQLFSCKPTNCTVEFITKPLPNRRMEEAVEKLPEASDLTKAIALGHQLPRLKDQYEIPRDLTIKVPPGRKNRYKLPPNNESQKISIRQALNSRFTLIQGPPGTGKTVTGIKLVYWFCRKNTDLARKKDAAKKQVLYCGPSNSSVDVVTAFLKNRLGPLCPKIVRVYSKAIENQIYPIPRDTVGFSNKKTSYEVKAAEEHKDVALHHLIRKETNPYHKQIIEFDRKFQKNLKTPENVSDEEISRYQDTVKKACIEELKRYDVVLCTNAVSAGPRVTRGACVEQIIIDEAGMCMEPETLIPLVAHNAAQVVLIGDHQQLRPIVKSEVTRRLGLEKSMFERYNTKAIALKEQYRMHPEICEFPALKFYPEVGLKTYESMTWRNGTELPIWPNSQCPIVFCHVAGAEKTLTVSTVDGNEQSKSNTAEKDHAVRIYSELVNMYHVKEQYVAVMSQYKAQCTDIYNELKAFGFQKPIVDTVVAAQGEEWDYVILSCVRSLPDYEIERHPSIGWKKRNLGFIIDYHQINVAITRARKGLIILGNEALLKCDDLWSDLLEHYRKQGCVVEGDKFPYTRQATRDGIRRNIAVNAIKQKQLYLQKRNERR